jgi:flagellar hook assembly protein FlgD
LRKTAFALAFALVASLGIIVPSVAAATGDPKVVIIVGPTGSQTSSFRSSADAAYVEALKYTSNVVRVYSPNATWAKVKAAVVGASIVVYSGHGNGWPSPYTFDPAYKTKDGFGLNATLGAGDNNHVYYGEPSVATLDMAPGAIVLLHHLCYAAGNSEPGTAEPTVSVARQRADNYAAGFLKGGASAVIADGHSGAASYIRALFTTHQSIEDMWRTMPNENGNITSFGSVRTPGARAFQDPNTPTSGFYRSLVVGSLGVTTDEVVSAGYGDTSADPASLLVPGNAAVSTAGATLYSSSDTSASAPTTLSAGTRLRVSDAPGAVTPEGARLVGVQGIDDTSISGFVAATELAARDSAAPVIRGLDAGGPFSPNGDGQGDAATMSGRFTESVAWTLRVRNNADAVLLERTGTGISFQTEWNGLVSGHGVPDGTYTVTLTGVDSWGNAPASATRSVTVDTEAPTLSALTPGAESGQTFAPNGDGVRDTVAFTATTGESGGLVARVLAVGGAVVKQWSVATGTGATAVTWDGRTTAGAYAADGVYTLSIAPQDAAGNVGEAAERTVTLIGALRSVTTSKTLFFPNDMDTLAQGTLLSFTLARPMTVTWAIRTAAGSVVRTAVSGAALGAGVHPWTFDGRGSDGAMLPRGRYLSYLTATDGTLTISQSVAFDLDAFGVTVNDRTPGRGQLFTVYATSAEPLAIAPTLYVVQPGLAQYAVRMVRTGTYTYKVTIRLKSTGRTGTMSLRVKGQDVKGGIQATIIKLPLH